MTLAIGVTSPKAIWLLTDRRLTYYSRPGSPEDRARKMLLLSSGGDVALLGYAGVGETARGVEPSEWMAQVVRRRNLPLEKLIELIASAAKRQMGPHVRTGHVIMAVCFVDRKPRLYAIEMTRKPGTSEGFFRTIQHARKVDLKHGQRSPRVGLAGSGAPHMTPHERELLISVVKAHDRGRVSAHAVSKFLATLNLKISKRTRTVSPECIVAWRLATGGGDQEMFIGADLHPKSHCVEIPSISDGLDFNAWSREVFKIIGPRLAALGDRPVTELLRDAEALGDEVVGAATKLPGPDETLK